MCAVHYIINYFFNFLNKINSLKSLKMMSEFPVMKSLFV
jgi:hypothetical protein